MSDNEFQTVKVVCLGTTINTAYKKFIAIQLIDDSEQFVGEVALFSKLKDVHG